MSTFQGIFANLPTPFSENGALDLNVLKERIDQLLEIGVDGFSTQLSAGEFAYLTVPERIKLTQATIEYVHGRAPVLVGVSAYNTKDTIRLTQNANALKADAAMVLPLSYFRLTKTEVLHLYETIDSISEIPLGIYNNPQTSRVDIDADFYKDIVKKCNIRVTKDGSGDPARFMDLEANGVTKTVDYLIGTEYQVFAGLLSGAPGCCNAVNAVIPSTIIELRKQINAKQIDEARGIVRRLQPLYEILRQYGVARTVKALAKLLGCPYGENRAPLLGLDNEGVSQLANAVEFGRLSGLPK